MLDLTTLRQRCSDGESFEYIYFWGHQPSKDGRIGPSCMSQWYAASFEIDGIRYPTAEHWMMASKARMFSDEDALNRILQASDPKEVKALGRSVKNFDNNKWSEGCRDLVVEGNRAKFSQNEDLKRYLSGTSPKILVEASPVDRLWGIGLSQSDEKAKHPSTWDGQNLLGFALMVVREQLV